MATYPLQGPPHAGAAVTLSAPGGTTGDQVTTGQGLGLLVSNGGTGVCIVTLPVGPTYDGLAVTSRTFSVPPIAGSLPGLGLIPLPDSVYGVGTTGVQYSTVSSVNVASIRIP